MLGDHIVLRRVFRLVAVVIGTFGVLGNAQTDTAKIFGFVVDRSGRYMPNVSIELVDLDRGLRWRTKTNSAGFYVFSDVKPAAYRMQASAIGFKTVNVPDIMVVVQDNIDQTFMLSPGDPSDTATQSRGAPLNITGAVSTVVDADLITNLPLNGRSFQTLFQLVPGIVITPTSFANQGQFSVNGQRTDANYFVIDGVSANFAIAGGVDPGQSAGGSLPALSVFGSTNSLVSTDDVQEFAVLTSSYSPEFGRFPGAQVSIVTRSGTNKLAGRVFDYLRNDAFDANDWFANNEGLKRASLRQNDYGGVLGGPIASDKAFFFASFEGLKLRQPTSSVTEVPSLAVRNSAPAALKPFLNAYPLPNGPGGGDGLAQAAYAFSNPSSLDSLSFRVDHHFRESLSTFARYVHSTSDAQQRGVGSNSLSTVTDTHFEQQALTVGQTAVLNQRIINGLRFNWSEASAASKNQLDGFGGAITLFSQLLFPPRVSQDNSLFQFVPAVDARSAELALGRNVHNTQSQINLVDDVSCQVHGHLLKAGIDFRALSPKLMPPVYDQEDLFSNIKSAVSGTTLITAIVAAVPVRATFKNYSVYVQDAWKPINRMSVTYGVRWEYAPAAVARGSNGLQPFALDGFNNLPALSVEPPGRPLYRATPDNFAPRLGFAYEIRRSPGTESVIRGGGGIFYALGNGSAGNALGGISFPFVAQKFLFGIPFPLSPTAAAPPSITTNPPFSLIQAFPAVLRTPYTYHWNVSLEQAFGASQALTVGYVGVVGRSLLRTEEYIGGQAGLPSAFTQLLLTDNAGYSTYNSLQVKFERRSKADADIIASYSLSHSLDNVSTDASFGGIPARFRDPRLDYGPSDFDIRHTATIGLDYTLPHNAKFHIFGTVLAGWSIDPIVMIRSAPPVDVVVSRDVGFGTYNFRPDLTFGVPLYLQDSNVPAGRRINLAALSVPIAPGQGDLGRNFFRGFPLFQTDLAIRRHFRISERVGFQARAEAFNLFNHPNFSPPAGQLGTVGPRGNFTPQGGFGVSQEMLAQGFKRGSFGSGFSPLYQIGGPRSVQLGLKFEF